MNDEPILSLELFREIDNKTEKLNITFSEIDSVEEIQKTYISKQKYILYYLNLKNGQSYSIDEKLYQMINNLIDKNPNCPECGRKL